MKCTCDDWVEGIAELDSRFTFASLHDGKIYKGPLFRYCPWCGAELSETE